MVDAYNRWCLFCDVEIHSAARRGPRVRLSEYFEDIVARSNRGVATMVFDNESRIARIAQARVIALPNGNPGLAFVVTLGDRRGAGPAFLHFARGDAREAERFEGEVKGVSAHCIIDLQEDDVHVGRHRMLLEETRGIGRTPITRLLRSELRTISTDRDERFRDPETGGRNQVRPVIEVWPHQSRQMAEALAVGRFGMVELFDTRRPPGFDETPEYTVKRHSLRVKVEPQAGRTFAESLEQLKTLGQRSGYGMMRVSWRLPGGDTGASEMHTDVADVGTALLAHRELVHVDDPMPECTHLLCDPFVHAMAAHFV